MDKPINNPNLDKLAREGYETERLPGETDEQLVRRLQKIIENSYPACKVEQNDGLYDKYTVVKNSTGELVTNCFVLKPLKDETARKALLFYADNCKIPQLSADIKKWLQELEKTGGST